MRIQAPEQKETPGKIAVPASTNSNKAKRRLEQDDEPSVPQSKRQRNVFYLYLPDDEYNPATFAPVVASEQWSISKNKKPVPSAPAAFRRKSAQRVLLTNSQGLERTGITQMSLLGDSIGVPRTFKEAMISSQKVEWFAACREGLKSFQRDETFDILEEPPASKVLSSKWVFGVEKNGKERKYTAGLVACGPLQADGTSIDTYAPGANIDSFRMILALTAIRGWKLRHLDASASFLKKSLGETIYMRPPQGVSMPGNCVWQLKRGMYATKQIPGLWCNIVARVLKRAGYRRSVYDERVFFTDRVLIAVYIDDIIVSGADRAAIRGVTSLFANNFNTRSLSIPKVFLGMTIDITGRQIKLSSRDYIEQMVENLALRVNKKRTGSPIPSKWKLRWSKTPALHGAEKKQYRSILSMLKYISDTARLDIACSVSLLARYVDDPHEIHMKSLHAIVDYLVNTRNEGIVYERMGSVRHTKTDFLTSKANFDCIIPKYPGVDWLPLTVYNSSSYWEDTGESQRGMVLALNGNALSWQSAKSSGASASIMEADMRAVGHATAKALHFRHVLNELGFGIDYFNFVSDYVPTLRNCFWFGKHPKLFYMDRWYFEIFEEVKKSNARLWQIDASENPAKGLSKRLKTNKLDDFKSQLIK